MAPLPANQFRYALYLAPPHESDLWRFGCNVIGRDARTGAPCEGFSLEGYPPDSWRSMTSEPRRYGFHATLKAPFPLRLDLDVADLFDRVHADGTAIVLVTHNAALAARAQTRLSMRSGVLT